MNIPQRQIDSFEFARPREVEQKKKAMTSLRIPKRPDPLLESQSGWNVDGTAKACSGLRYPTWKCE
jgi:hypothetical protein